MIFRRAKIVLNMIHCWTNKIEHYVFCNLVDENNMKQSDLILNVCNIILDSSP